MPRKKGIAWNETGRTLVELCKKYDLDPGEELIRLAKERVNVATKDGREVEMPVLVAHMGYKDGYKLYVEVLKSLDAKVRPTLRATEHSGVQNNVFNVTIKQFGVASQPKILEIDPHTHVRHEPDSTPQIHAPGLPEEGVDVLPE